MLKKPVLGLALVLALLCISTFAYWSTSRGAQTYFSIQNTIDPNAQTLLTLFNPSPELTVAYQLYLPTETRLGTLAPLASASFSVVDQGSILLESDNELIAWNQVRGVADDLEYRRDTQRFQRRDEATNGLLFPWFQDPASNGQAGNITLLNTDPFTADIIYTLYEAETGRADLEAYYQIPPNQSIQFPATSAFTVSTPVKYARAISVNSANLLGQYHGPQQENFRYWAQPTYAFTSLTALRETPTAAQTRPNAKTGTNLQVASRSTLPFSSDHLLFQGHGVDSWYRFHNKNIHNAVSGLVQGQLTQSAVPFGQNLSALGAGVPISFEPMTFFPDPSYRSGTLDIDANAAVPVGFALYRGTSDLAATGPAAPMTHRAVFPIDGREPWHDQLADSVFVFNNRQSTDLPLAVALLDENGNLLAVRYPILAPGASELSVDQLVGAESDTRILLFESGRVGDLLSLHLLVTGSGAGFSAAIVDYIAPAPAPGCSTVGLGPEHYFNWGRPYTPSCADRPASVLGLVEQVNQGHPPPYAD